MQIALGNSVHVRDLAHAQCGVGKMLVNVADDFATLPHTEAFIVDLVSRYRSHHEGIDRIEYGFGLNLRIVKIAISNRPDQIIQ